jgi:hypothetical protein
MCRNQADTKTKPCPTVELTEMQLVATLTGRQQREVESHLIALVGDLVRVSAAIASLALALLEGEADLGAG